MKKVIKTKMYKNYSSTPSFTMEGDVFDGLNDDEYEVEVVIKVKEKIYAPQMLEFMDFLNNTENSICLLTKRNGQFYGSKNKIAETLNNVDVHLFSDFCKSRLDFILKEIWDKEFGRSDDSNKK